MTIDDPVRPAAGVTAMRSPSTAEQRRHVSTSAKLTSPQRGHFRLDMETVVSVVGRRRPERERRRALRRTAAGTAGVAWYRALRLAGRERVVKWWAMSAAVKLVALVRASSSGVQ